MTILYLLIIVAGMFGFLVGVLSLRVARRKQKMPTRVTYGAGVNKHLIQTGIEIEHGMVITDSHKLQAQSKTSEGHFEAMLIK